VSIMKQVSDSKVDSVGLTDQGHVLITTDHVGSTSVDRPVAGFGNYTAIQQYVRSQMPDGYIVHEHAGIAVLAPTVTGAAADGAMLANYGYTVTATAATTAAVQQPVLVDRSNGKDPYTLHYLQSHFGVTAVKTLPAGVTAVKTLPAGVTLDASTTTHTKFVIIEPK
jgi:hypothetical protein